MQSRRRLTEQLMVCCGLALLFYTVKIIVYTPKNLPALRLRKSEYNEVDLPPRPRLLVATRIHMKAATSMPDLAKVIKFIRSSQLYSDGILICIGAEQFDTITTYIASIKNQLMEEKIDSVNISLLPVFPWGYFTTSLNAAIQYAQDQHFSLIAFQSLEVNISYSEVKQLVQRIRVSDTIVVGPVLEGHEFTAGSEKRCVVPLCGRTCPWNTFAIWRVRELGFVGFPLIGDGTGNDRASGGVEELTAITLLQKIRPEFTAVLLKFPSDNTTQAKEGANHSWDTKFVDPERQKYHIRKMESKNSRPASQLVVMGIDAGNVVHESA